MNSRIETHIEVNAAYPPLQIRLHEDFEKLPAGISIQLPKAMSHSLITRRLASPVGDFSSVADLTLDENDLETLGISWHLETPLAA